MVFKDCKVQRFQGGCTKMWLKSSGPHAIPYVEFPQTTTVGNWIANVNTLLL